MVFMLQEKMPSQSSEWGWRTDAVSRGCQHSIVPSRCKNIGWTGCAGRSIALRSNRGFHVTFVKIMVKSGIVARVQKIAALSMSTACRNSEGIMSITKDLHNVPRKLDRAIIDADAGQNLICTDAMDEYWRTTIKRNGATEVTFGRWRSHERF